jgi:hypothetical protein
VNHLGDTNKMVGETPRTEAEVNRQKCWSDDLVTIDANFACQLERELNAANEMFRKLNIHTLNLTDRIKRLEEAGDAILNANNDDEEYEAIKQWYKVKEAKP